MLDRTPFLASFFVAAASLLGCAGDPAEFRPAKHASSYPSVKDAFRVQEAPTECTSIGTVHAEKEGEGGNIEDIAKTAARHGGTHYVVRSDKTEITGYSGGGFASGRMVAVRVEPEKTRWTWAQVYRCPS